MPLTLAAVLREEFGLNLDRTFTDPIWGIVEQIAT